MFSVLKSGAASFTQGLNSLARQSGLGWVSKVKSNPTSRDIPSPLPLKQGLQLSSIQHKPSSATPLNARHFSGGQEAGQEQSTGNRASVAKPISPYSSIAQCIDVFNWLEEVKDPTKSRALYSQRADVSPEKMTQIKFEHVFHEMLSMGMVRMELSPDEIEGSINEFRGDQLNDYYKRQIVPVMEGALLGPLNTLEQSNDVKCSDASLKHLFNMYQSFGKQHVTLKGCYDLIQNMRAWHARVEPDQELLPLNKDFFPDLPYDDTLSFEAFKEVIQNQVLDKQLALQSVMLRER